MPGSKKSNEPNTPTGPAGSAGSNQLDQIGGSDRHGPSGGLPGGLSRGVFLPAALIRVGTLVCCHLMLMFTAFTLIPGIGVFVSANSAVNTSTAPTGQVAFWLVPFLFLVMFLAVGEFFAMRWLWRCGTRWIARIRTRAAINRSSVDTDSVDTADSHEPSGHRGNAAEVAGRIPAVIGGRRARPVRIGR